MYDIKPRTERIANELAVIIFPSDNPKYKLDVYDGRGRFMFRIGSSAYSDYPTYIETHGKKFADNRRRLYILRHAKEIENVGTRGWFAYKLLWT